MASAAVGEGELEQLRLGDGLGGAGLDAEVAVDAAQVVDLVDEAVALAGADRVVGRVVLAAHVDAPGRAHAGAQLAADALLHAVLVPVEDVTAVEADRLVPLAALVLRRTTRVSRCLLAHLAERDQEASEVAHQSNTSSDGLGAAPGGADGERQQPVAGGEHGDGDRRPRGPGSSPRSSPTRSAASSSSQPSDSGISSFQPRSMSWS